MTQTLTQALTRTALPLWATPVYQGDFNDADQFNPQLRSLILAAQEAQERPTVLPGGIDAMKSSEDILQWEHPAIAWLQRRIMGAVTALTRNALGDEAAGKIRQKVIAEGWAVTYAEGASLLPHTHHDSPWSGVYYVDSGVTAAGQDPGYLQLWDPRPGAIARHVSPGGIRVQPVPGRMVAFPGWLPHQVRATAGADRLRICVAFNVGYTA